jgi:tetratricopeptide (TPR) repeat protein
LGLAEALIVQEKLDQAIAVYEKMLADDPKQPIALNDLAYLYARKGQHLDRALDLARWAVKFSPEQGTPRDTLGWVCYRLGRPQEALAHLQEAVRLRPERGLYHYHLGKSLLAAGRYSEAAESFRTALSRGLPPAERSDAEDSLAATGRGRK